MRRVLRTGDRERPIAGHGGGHADRVLRQVGLFQPANFVLGQCQFHRRAGGVDMTGLGRSDDRCGHAFGKMPGESHARARYIPFRGNRADGFYDRAIGVFLLAV